MFDMLQAMQADLSRVLDLYAGTGALGIEALSRGDGRCDFVEKDSRFCQVIRDNLQITNLADRSTVFCLPVERALTRLSGEYSLILADPPYQDEKVEGLLQRVAASSLTGAETVILWEHSKRKEPAPALGSLGLLTSRRHGDTVFSVYRSGGNP